MNDDTIRALATKHGSTYTNRHFLNDPRFVFTAGGLKNFVNELLAAQPQAETCTICGDGQALLFRICDHCGSEYRGKREAQPQAAQERVYLVATGEVRDGLELYERHDKPVPLADQEVLYTHPAPQVAQERVYLVATGEVRDGLELYERHDKPVPLADREVLYTHPAPQAAQAVPDGYALISKDLLRHWGRLKEVEEVCVYPTAPSAPAHPERKPLTDAQIEEITVAEPGTPLWLVAKAFARAIEAAHGIKENCRGREPQY